MAFDEAGAFRKMISITKSEWVKNAFPIEMLYVDCRHSLKNMSVVKLLDIVTDRKQVQHLIDNPISVNRDREIITNNSDQEKSYNLDFNIEVQDSVILKLDTLIETYLQVTSSHIVIGIAISM